jgi:hypothetical protein
MSVSCQKYKGTYPVVLPGKIGIHDSFVEGVPAVFLRSDGLSVTTVLQLKRECINFFAAGPTAAMGPGISQAW